MSKAAIAVHEEIENSFTPYGLGRWIKQRRNDDSELAGLFCMSQWLGPHIGDDAWVGAYSVKSTKATPPWIEGALSWVQSVILHRRASIAKPPSACRN